VVILIPLWQEGVVILIPPYFDSTLAERDHDFDSALEGVARLLTT
jgi:hypothetical protein